MATQPAPWWKQVDDAARLIASAVNAAAAKAGRDGVYSPPPGQPPPRRRRRAASLRHLAEVIRTHRLAPGVTVDKDVVGAVLAGDRRQLSNPVVVVAVAAASHRIAGVPFVRVDARRLVVAVARLNSLVQAAEEADRRAPELLPVRQPETALAGTVRPMPLPITRAGVPSRTARRVRLLIVLVVFAAGVLVGVTGSRLATSSASVADPPASPTAAPACRPAGESGPPGAVVMGLPGTPATGSAPADWWANDLAVGLTPAARGFVAVVPAGSTLPQQLIVIRSGITLTAGHHYRFDFTATGDRPVDVLLRIQDRTPPLYRPSLVQSVPISRVPCRRSYAFTAGMTSRTTGEVTFQLGGQGAYTVTVADAVLVETSP